MTLDIAAAAAVLLWAVLFARGLIGIRRTPAPRPTTGAVRGIVAFIPARDEADVIEASVGGVLAQPEVGRAVVVDDASTDETSAKLAAMRDPRLEVITGTGPAEGQCGKPAALDLAFRTAAPEAEWLLFVDADVVLEPGAVAALMELASDRDLVSVIPRVAMRTVVEHVVMPSVGGLVLARHPPPKVSAGEVAFANGQVILIRQQTYVAAGGHAGVVSEVLEDVRLAERVHSDGGRLCLVDGRHLATTRMYEGWTELAEGWTKNLYLLLGSSRSGTWGWIALTLVLGWIGPVVAIAAGWPFGVASWATIVLMQASLRAAGGAAWVWAVLAPLGALATAYLSLQSMRRHEGGGGVSWKGRRYR